MWDRGEQALAEVLGQRGLPYEAVAGEGAFYGPKNRRADPGPRGPGADPVDRPARLLPAQAVRASYVAADQSLRCPVMIHRSIVGSLERLAAHLTEVHAGAFPAWMAPVQVVVLPVTGQQL
jgi:threonyl-tRNA synthetase